MAVAWNYPFMLDSESDLETLLEGRTILSDKKRVKKVIEFAEEKVRTLDIQAGIIEELITEIKNKKGGK